MYFINYKEQQLPIIVDFAVIKNICNKLNIKFTQFEQIIDNPMNTEILFYEALKRAAKIEGVQLQIKESECEDILSESYFEFMKIFNECVLKLFTGKKEVDSKKN